jgi:hypothetical protein
MCRRFGVAARAAGFLLMAVSSAGIARDEGGGGRNVRFGALVGPSLPTPANVEVLVKFFDVIGVGGSYSFLPRNLSQTILSALAVKDATVDADAWDLEARVFPFSGAFFLGAAVGDQHVALGVKDSTGRSALDVRTRYATPRLGWLGIWGPGFSFAFDLGAQLPLRTQIAATGAGSQSGVLATASQYARVPQPSMNLRVGWMF